MACDLMIYGALSKYRQKDIEIVMGPTYQNIQTKHVQVVQAGNIQAFSIIDVRC